MANASVFDKLAERIAAALPADASLLKEDFNRTVRLALSNALARMDLVTREELDIQNELLARTRARLEALEARVQALEEAAGKRGDEGG